MLVFQLEFHVSVAMLHCSSDDTPPSGVPRTLYLLVGAALMLLPVMALLQYRWIGQVSDAERERRAADAEARHERQVTQELDVELFRAFVGLQVDGVTLRSDDWTVYTERVAGWRKATAAPGILRDVLLVDRRTHWSAPAPVVG